MNDLPRLYVEGRDDVSVINSLLFRHGLNTDCGKQHLFIKDLVNIETVLAAIADAIKANTDRPVGFVVDIDIEIANRWSAVCAKLREGGASPPNRCVPTGLIQTLPGYHHPFGVWLMPDCTTDCAKMEHLVVSLVPNGDPMWPLATQSVDAAGKAADAANEQFGEGFCKRFREVDRIKAEVHTWISWRNKPGIPLGAAINDKVLGCDSPQAIAFLKWLKDLYGFVSLAV